MKLSNLQKYILRQTWQSDKPKVNRAIFNKFYEQTKNPTSKLLQAKIITRSIERLIDKGLLTGFGEKTQYKLFISQIKLTPRGKNTAQKLLGQQVELPFKKPTRASLKK